MRFYPPLNYHLTRKTISQESSSWKQKKNAINVGAANIFPDENSHYLLLQHKILHHPWKQQLSRKQDNNGCIRGGDDDNHDDYDDVDDDNDDVQMKSMTNSDAVTMVAKN